MTTTKHATLVAHTARPIVMGITGQDTVVRSLQTVAAGTEVYVGRIRDNGECEIRVCGTLLTQLVHITDVTPA